MLMSAKCIVLHVHVCHLTWLSKAFDGVNNVHTVALSRDNEMQQVECLRPYNDGVAPGRQWQPLSGADMMVQHLYIRMLSLNTINV